jgi:hypothetical protein
VNSIGNTVGKLDIFSIVRRSFFEKLYIYHDSHGIVTDK